MSSLLSTLAAFVLALGVLIVVHEFGHYLVARWCGVKVLRFSVGFGRPIAAWRLGRDQTEWAVAAFPLGGYVKMLDEREGDVEPEELHRAFNRQPVAKRFAIVSAGPAANFILAVVLYWVLFVHGVTGLRPVLGEPPAASPAAVAGLRDGDTLSAIGGEPVPTWQDARWVLLDRALKGGSVNIEVRRASGEIAFRRLDLSTLNARDLDGEFLEKLGLTHYRPDYPPVLDKLLPEGAAAQAGLQPGDRVVSIDGKAIKRWSELVEAVQAAPGQPLAFQLERGGSRTVVDVTPVEARLNDKRIGRIGAGPRVDPALAGRMTALVRYSPVDALGKAVARTWDTSAFSLKMLGKMIVGEVSLKNISGPVTIADYAGQSAQMGIASYLNFLALISISLGVLNLLPIPLLDGGHLMYYIAEMFKGSPVSERIMEFGQQVGLALLFTLMALAFYNDITRLVSG